MESDKRTLHLIQYLKDSYSELRKVDWPSRQETIRQSLIVIGASAIVAVFLGTMDYIFATLLKKIL
ncbi:MAG: preprotein translocase subunit SecE [Candidatus Kerfeldbacteria bacterium RIFCSPHIGHO2_02_FULL_42_14]|uniref:Protein translocase subunit SecE n=1 Tax=Candidatus Kerfeldbacteria bacterium RIFCSPHIGHO2_02_FULL_42_14 TaxID=1798540 RepID=A0A1G2AR86_9BACT|nr:MAG: preprotein translocase subunit SecE [Candidatus Kerfeldbacteria bacterium RIFCSPHIGHO2_02_FULL_42_14]OGY80692.1 MAG: preprotein translocase subunit SecE [Candidatus Kerfeldbacteria bacterium RIFCSPHIGHO2_12_FULL_42_13]OGY82619.1 MAG: preprotein translocase subunit SecE [Candidatus Kerfeldbacteria bacterium RIFCSPLOWO2_02_FULL_42_19]OGY85222.1 MAG: preprotein translocase subunit SecE [Candidatus Kerfeldbacteria bacterium RIFCSPLOWO2_12_FULL_43_9]